MNRDTEYRDYTGFSTPSNHMEKSERVALPLPPLRGEEARFEMEVYARFMRHLREVPTSRTDIKVFAAIRFAADMMDTSDALVAKTLVDLGLKAPRRAFPAEFLKFVDAVCAKDPGDCPASLARLRAHWDAIGEDRFVPFLTGDYAVCDRAGYVDA